jgi:hypothetical protein
VNIRKRSSQRVVGRMYLEEDFTLVKCEVRNFTIIRCLVYSHFPKYKRERVEAIVEKGICVG